MLNHVVVAATAVLQEDLQDAELSDAPAPTCKPWLALTEGDTGE